MALSLKGTFSLWLAISFLLYASGSINDNGLCGQLVDAKDPDSPHSVSSQRSRPGYGLPESIVMWRIVAPSILKLRGGSNKSEVDSRTANKPKKSNDKDEKRKGSNKRKNKRKRKHTDNDLEEEENIDNRDETLEKSSEDPMETSDDAEEKQTLSKRFLVDPFRMNEIARYEASIADEYPNEEVNDDAEPEETTSSTIGSEGDGNDDRDAKKKSVRKGGKMKRKSKKTTSLDEDDLDTVNAEESKILADRQDEVRNGKRKVREQSQKLKSNASDDTANEDKLTTTEGNEDGSDNNCDDQLTPAEGDDATTAQSNSFWWIDVWTQQLSDPEDFEEEEDDAIDTMVDIEAISESSDSDAAENLATEKGGTRKIGKEEEKRNFKKKNEKEQHEPTQMEENVELPLNVDGNATITSDSDSLAKAFSTNQSTLVVIDGNLTEPVPELENTVSYVSSGAWIFVDNIITLGLASQISALRLSRKLRRIRKLSARITRLHGLLSGKPHPSLSSTESHLELLDGNATALGEGLTDVNEEATEDVQKRIAAIDKAREGVRRAQEEEIAKRRKRSFWGFRSSPDIDLALDSNETSIIDEVDPAEETKIPEKTPEEIEEELRRVEEERQRMERVSEIDRLIAEGQQRLADLICEKDVLQRRPNPLFNYTTIETVVTTEQGSENDKVSENKNKTGQASSTDTNTTSKVEIQASREMNFPPDDLVAEYLDMMISTRRLIKMNHTDLWKESDQEGVRDEDESIGDDLFTASADAHRLYQGASTVKNGGNGSNKGKKGGGGGSWLLRQSIIGSRRSLGEKIGEAAETAAYKAVTSSLMSFLARMISSLHGINVMKHSDIRLVLEQSPDLPPVPKDGIIRGDHENYAEETIKTVMRRKTRRSKKRSKHRLSASFVQQEAVTETLLSHVQISAPLLKLFPLAWQRALLGNIITLACAIISDFLDGLQFQILGHQLSFAFRPITEVDMARHFQMAGGRFNQRRYKAAEFEAAVQATAEDLKEELKFLDSWHERALGSGVLRTQIANMIARIVLTLTDEVLSGARLDLWSTQAGGPRLLAGLEHRKEEEYDQ